MIGVGVSKNLEGYEGNRCNGEEGIAVRLNLTRRLKLVEIEVTRDLASTAKVSQNALKFFSERKEEGKPENSTLTSLIMEKGTTKIKEKKTFLYVIFKEVS